MTGPVEVRRVRLGVVLLCHARLDVAAHMARIWVQGGARVAIHVDAKASARSVARMQVELSDLPGIVWSRRHTCDWLSLIHISEPHETKGNLVCRLMLEKKNFFLFVWLFLR